MGAGHVMRTLALAERAHVDGHAVVWLAARLDPPLAERVRRAGIELLREEIEPGTAQDLAWLVRQATARSVDWIVTDGYRFDAAYHEALREAGFRVLCIDDQGARARYAAHVVLNQNVAAAEALYTRRSADTRLLLGPTYALLRSEIAAAHARAPLIAERATQVLVTLGGADPGNATAHMLEALRHVPGADLRVQVVVGPSNPHRQQLVELAADPRVQILTVVEDMAAAMQAAELALSAAGTTVYELCCVGVPTLLVSITEFQRTLARALDERRMCVDLGWTEAMDARFVGRKIAAVRDDGAWRADLSRRARAAVDGRGAERVLAALALRPA